MRRAALAALDRVIAGRSHLRGDGRPKVAYPSLDAAAVVADARSIPGEVRFVAYRCPHCPAFHLGRPRLRPVTASDAEWVELGDRVVWHLRRENARPDTPPSVSPASPSSAL